jgi:hypothetical protein
MIADDGRTPILMDFGSCLPARIPVPTRSIALTQQDIAAEHCSMPFRAPELFDVRQTLFLHSPPCFDSCILNLVSGQNGS